MDIRHMSTTRRATLGAALAAPLLTRFTGTASAEAAGTLGTISAGWVEVRWTKEAQEQLDRFGAVVEAVAPARLVHDSSGPAVRFPVRSGTGDPSLDAVAKAQGDGALDGGIAIRTANGTFRVTGLSSDLHGGLVSGKCAINGVYAEYGAVAKCGLDEARLTTENVPPGKPMKVSLADVPLRATPELLAGYAVAFGSPSFTTETALAHLTAEGVYHPPTP
jgi:hypothetical protein